jgi:hypothetical protein
MNQARLLAVGAGAVAVTIALLTAASILHKWVRGMSERRRHRLEAAIRPELMRTIVEGQVLDTLVTQRGGRGRAVEALANEYLPKLRGEAHAVVAELLDRRGVVARARRRARRPGLRGRARAAELLGAVGSVESISVLGRLLHDRDPAVRVVAARALGRIRSPAAVTPLLASLDGPRSNPFGMVAAALLEIGSAGADELRRGLRAVAPPVRALAAEALGLLRVVPAANELIALLRADPEIEVRIRAARALGRIGAPNAVDALIAALDHEQPTPLRAVAAASLGQMDVLSAVPLLVARVDDESYWVAHNASRALAGIEPRGLGALRSIATSSRPGAAHAREALAFAALYEAKGDPNWLHWVAPA